jgi:hypothetical protein
MKDHESTHDQELQATPLLWSLKDQQEQQWEPPAGYFDQLSTQLQDRMEEEAWLAQAPHLQCAGKRLSFQAPAGYFDQLPLRIQSRLRRSPARVVSLWERVSYGVVAVAAALAMIWLLRSAVPDGDRPQPPAAVLAWEDIPTAQLMAWAEASEMEPYLILEVMQEEGAGSQNLDLNPLPQLSDEALEPLLDEVEVEDLEAIWLETQANEI